MTSDFTCHGSWSQSDDDGADQDSLLSPSPSASDDEDLSNSDGSLKKALLQLSKGPRATSSSGLLAVTPPFEGDRYLIISPSDSVSQNDMVCAGRSTTYYCI